LIDYKRIYTLITDITLANPEVFIDIIQTIFLFIVLLLGKGEYFHNILKGTGEEGANEDNDEGNNDEDNLEYYKDIENSNKNDNSDNDENNDEDATKTDKGKRKATKEEEEAWEVEYRATNTGDNNNDDDYDEDGDSYKKAQIQHDEQLAKNLQSEEYKANTINNYNSDSSYSVLSSNVNEDDTNERANKKLDVKELEDELRAQALVKAESDKKIQNKRKHNEDGDGN